MTQRSKIKQSILFALLMSVSAPAVAQSHNFSNDIYQSDSQARLTLTVPFGAEKQSTKTEPRLEFGVRNYQAQPDFTSWAYRDAPYKEAKIGLTLSSQPKFLQNGDVVYFTSDRNDLSDGQKVAVGVGIGVVALAGLVIGGVLLYADSFD